MEQPGPEGAPDEGVDTKSFLLPQYKVILHNDDITPMDFVIAVLERFFSTPHEQAREIMLEAHNRGSAVVTLMPLEHAEFAVERAHAFSRSHDYPLTFTIEPA